MYTRSETFFKGHDGVRLYLQAWQSTDDARATVFITHGQAEHSDCYQRLVDGLASLIPLNFVGWDLRGHGKSDGVRGYAREFQDYVHDYRTFMDESLKLSFVKGKKVFALAHSMGALIQVCALGERSIPQLDAQILSSPLFGLNLEVPAWKEGAAGVLNSLFPKLTLGNEITHEQLTRDLDVIREYEKDTFRHGKISSSVFLGMKQEMARVMDRAGQIDLPTFLSIPDADPVVSTKSALDFFNRLSISPEYPKILKIVEGGKHELYNDVGREEIYKSIADFCRSLIGV